MAHELAHDRNGDASRGLAIVGAVQGLAHLYYVLDPGPGDSIFDVLMRAGHWLVSRPLAWTLTLEFHLLVQDMQRAEYLADAVAAHAAGAAAAVELHERTLLASTFYGVVHHGARDGVDGLLDRAAAVLDAVPERERERRRRVARLETSRLDVTHPPIALRIELVETRGASEPAVTLDAAGSAAIDAELRAHRPAVEHRLVDEYRATLYY